VQSRFLQQRQYKSELRSTKHESPHPNYREAKVPGRGIVWCCFHASEKHKDSGQGKTMRASPRRGNQSNRTTDVARQHNTGRQQEWQDDKKSGGLNPAPGEHTRWAVLSLVRYIVKTEPAMGQKGWGGLLDWKFVWGASLWMRREPSGILVTSLWTHRENSWIVGVSLTGPVNAQGAQWGCTVSEDGPGVQQDCVGVCVWV